MFLLYTAVSAGTPIDHESKASYDTFMMRSLQAKPIEALQPSGNLTPSRFTGSCLESVPEEDESDEGIISYQAALITDPVLLTRSSGDTIQTRTGRNHHSINSFESMDMSFLSENTLHGIRASMTKSALMKRPSGRSQHKKPGFWAKLFCCCNERVDAPRRKPAK